MMASVVMALAFFFLGTLAGALLLSRWWVKHMKKPEVAREFLKNVYKDAHPHWLQPSEDDPRRMCPVCGWTAPEDRAPDL